MKTQRDYWMKNIEPVSLMIVYVNVTWMVSQKIWDDMYCTFKFDDCLCITKNEMKSIEQASLMIVCLSKCYMASLRVVYVDITKYTICIEPAS
jgi:hypothetical protein